MQNDLEIENQGGFWAYERSWTATSEKILKCLPEALRSESRLWVLTATGTVFALGIS